MVREVLHIDMDAFFVSVEEVLDPSLKGKPVVVGGNPEGRGVVAAASYAARAFGIHSAMPVARAYRLCPDAIFLSGSHKRYSEFSRRIFEILERYTPLVEPMSLDEGYLDLTGCERLHGPAPETAVRIRNEIENTIGINASIGMASNKLMAKIASGLSKPNGFFRILPGQEASLLRPLPVGRIPGIGPKSQERLRKVGIRTVGQLAQLPRDLLEDVYGQWGTEMYLRARGVCDSPVRRREEARSISRETTLEKDTLDAAFLESTLSYLTERASQQLRDEGLRAKCITLKLRYSDFSTVTRSRTLKQPASEDHLLFQTALELFRNVFTRRTRVRLIGIGFSSFTSGPVAQMDLFEAAQPKQWDALYQGIDRLRAKYGFNTLQRARGACRSAQ